MAAAVAAARVDTLLGRDQPGDFGAIPVDDAGRLLFNLGTAVAVRCPKGRSYTAQVFWLQLLSQAKFDGCCSGRQN